MWAYISKLLSTKNHCLVILLANVDCFVVVPTSNLMIQIINYSIKTTLITKKEKRNDPFTSKGFQTRVSSDWRTVRLSNKALLFSLFLCIPFSPVPACTCIFFSLNVFLFSGKNPPFWVWWSSYLQRVIRSLNSNDSWDKVDLVSIHPYHISVVAQELLMSTFDLLNVVRELVNRRPLKFTC